MRKASYAERKLQTAQVGDLVKSTRGGKFSKKGILWKVVEVKQVKSNPWDQDQSPVWKYKLKATWALLDGHKRKQSFWEYATMFEVLDVVDLGRQCLELQNIVRDYAKMKSGAEEEETVP
jgi:hypothetical protein